MFVVCEDVAWLGTPGALGSARELHGGVKHITRFAWSSESREVGRIRRGSAVTGASRLGREAGGLAERAAAGTGNGERFVG